MIVVGYGRFGQTAAQMLMAKRVRVTLIDKKPEQIELAGKFGTKVYYGDGMRLDLLRRRERRRPRRSCSATTIETAS